MNTKNGSDIGKPVGKMASLKREDDGDEEQSRTRSRSASSEHQKLLTDIPKGVSFFSLMNQRKRFYLPSSKNIFGGFKVSRVLCDSGCSSLLLPITSPESLKAIFDLFGVDCKFSIKGSRNVGGKSACLVVEYMKSQRRFEVNLCYDIMGITVIYTKRIRFSLCREDIETIQNSDLSRYDPASVACLASLTGPEQRRRTHALLGQDILSEFTLLKHGHVELYVDPSEYTLPASFQELTNQTISLEMQLRKDLPESFDDWEDDDFAYEDDEILSSEDFE